MKRKEEEEKEEEEDYDEETGQALRSCMKTIFSTTTRQSKKNFKDGERSPCIMPTLERRGRRRGGSRGRTGPKKLHENHIFYHHQTIQEKLQGWRKKSLHKVDIEEKRKKRKGGQIMSTMKRKEEEKEEEEDHDEETGQALRSCMKTIFSTTTRQSKKNFKDGERSPCIMSILKRRGRRRRKGSIVRTVTKFLGDRTGPKKLHENHIFYHHQTIQEKLQRWWKKSLHNVDIEEKRKKKKMKEKERQVLRSCMKTIFPTTTRQFKKNYKDGERSPCMEDISTIQDNVDIEEKKKKKRKEQKRQVLRSCLKTIFPTTTRQCKKNYKDGERSPCMEDLSTIQDNVDIEEKKKKKRKKEQKQFKKYYKDGERSPCMEDISTTQDNVDIEERKKKRRKKKKRKKGRQVLRSCLKTIFPTTTRQCKKNYKDGERSPCMEDLSTIQDNVDIEEKKKKKRKKEQKRQVLRSCLKTIFPTTTRQCKKNYKDGERSPCMEDISTIQDNVDIEEKKKKKRKKEQKRQVLRSCLKTIFPYTTRQFKKNYKDGERSPCMEDISTIQDNVDNEENKKKKKKKRKKEQKRQVLRSCLKTIFPTTTRQFKKYYKDGERSPCMEDISTIQDIVDIEEKKKKKRKKEHKSQVLRSCFKTIFPTTTRQFKKNYKDGERSPCMEDISTTQDNVDIEEKKKKRKKKRKKVQKRQVLRSCMKTIFPTTTRQSKKNYKDGERSPCMEDISTIQENVDIEEKKKKKRKEKKRKKEQNAILQVPTGDHPREALFLGIVRTVRKLLGSCMKTIFSTTTGESKKNYKDGGRSPCVKDISTIEDNVEKKQRKKKKLKEKKKKKIRPSVTMQHITGGCQMSIFPTTTRQSKKNYKDGGRSPCMEDISTIQIGEDEEEEQESLITL
ncbi:glutamic acid-rich protein-like [Harmonia axyridis]|uniref:glutamic acid-rich protein-like n=1 Tax=Harmonia axyridis TaxID=115357 RepID=UPI001E275C61|nr:glutamic acid-rich protein-like [Harmonia axyridis]